ncbi:alpha/beta fold hydrolase [Cognatishimia sp. F0-27]|uniref:alpha/beta fold hydrolase n=1 Tax=Cognatishimia sp. F0-27 TaxID=2816855 RepID=UPI001D0C02B1|nr:hypothetical protein [Cognatishimia sp. F0-27]MCC1493073.1 hypothetical protein [Cognatishimia sp. F0-27]
MLIEPGYLDADGRTSWETESRRYMSGFRYGWQALLTGFRAQHVSGPDAAAQEDFLVGHMVGIFTNHPDNPYHCGDGYSAPNWRFGALSSSTWRNAPDAAMDRLAFGATAFSGSVLLMSGACNNWLGPLQPSFLSRFENAALAVIQDAGHDVVWDNPDAALAAISAFLD